MDLPDLAMRFREVWDVNIDESWEADDVQPDVRAEVKEELIKIMQYSHVMPPEEDKNIFIIQRMSKRFLDDSTDGNDDGPQDPSLDRKERKRRRWSGSSRQSSSPVFFDKNRPVCDGSVFDYSKLKAMWTEEEQYMEVGRLKIGLKGTMKKENRFEVNQ